MDKHDFDYTSRMIAELNGVTSKLVDPTVQWPSMGDERYCSDCTHWSPKADGKLHCELGVGESGYCRTHGKPYYSRKKTFKPFLSEEDMEIE